MSHDHNHNHDHGAGDAPLRALAAALAITTGICVAEFVGGWLSGSVALLADAMHMLSDAAGLLIAVLAVLIGRRQASRTATYGYRRTEVLAALTNALSVLIITVFIVIEAVRRLRTPAEIDAGTMIGIAVVGLAANVVSAWVLARHRDHSVNVRGAYLHVMVDALGSVAVIVAGTVVALTGFAAADVIASLAIAGLVVPRAWQLLTDSSRVLLEQVPANFRAAEVEPALLRIDGVIGAHDLHLWSVDGVSVLATAHLVLADAADPNAVLDKAQAALKTLGIDHSTIQLERPEHKHHESICEN